jgi:2-methylcitrate dehydratase PrpD
MTSVTERLASWALSLSFDDIPEKARHSAKRHLLDGVGLAVAARRLGAAQAAISVGEQFATLPGVRALGSNELLAPGAAALVDGVLVHALDFDDTHAGGLVHATAVSLPAVFAAGQREGSSGAESLIAAVIGLETVCRIAAASPHGFHARGLHATSICGTLSSALVDSRLAKVSVPTATSALGIAGSLSGGLLEFLDTGSDTKTLHPGLASMNGLLAANLARAGGNGPDTVLEGRRGIFATMSDREADAESIVACLGQRWESTQISIKPIPACQLLHVTLDAVANSPGSWQDIVDIEAVVHPDSAGVVCEPRDPKNHPKSSYDAKFSLPWSLAARLIDGQVSLDTYSDEAIGRPEVAALAAKVRIVPGPTDIPAADAAGEVRIRYADGSAWEGTVAGSRGTPQNPLSDEDLQEKFLLNCGSHPMSVELHDAIMNIEKLPSLDAIHDLAAGIVQQKVVTV